MLDNEKFVHETKMLQKVRMAWDKSDNFYYLGNVKKSPKKPLSNLITAAAPFKQAFVTPRNTSKKEKKQTLYTCPDWLSRVSCGGDGGVIVMRPADRLSVHHSTDKLRAFAELLACVKRTHSQNILHLDLRPPNLLHFNPGGWQVVDFDHAVKASGGTGRATIHVKSGQAECAGYTLKQRLKRSCDSSNLDKHTVTVNESDDIEMLNAKTK